MLLLRFIGECADLSLAARQATLLGAPPIEQSSRIETHFQSSEGYLLLREFRDADDLSQPEGAAQAVRQAQLATELPGDDAGAWLVAEARAKEPEAMKAFFARTAGIRGVVRSTRITYPFYDAFIHLDDVAGLGGFICVELELKEGDDPAAARSKASSLAETIGAIGPELGSYIDLLPSARRASGG